MIPAHYKVNSCCSDCFYSGVNRIKVELGMHTVKDRNGNYFDVERDLPWDYFWDDQQKKIAAQVYCDAYRRSIQFPLGWRHCIKKLTQAEFEAQQEAKRQAKHS